VFDGAKAGEPTESRTIEGGVSVVYTRLGETADAVIKKMLTGERHHIVITSDREIQSHAWAHNSTPLDSEDFMCVLEEGGPGGPSASRRSLSKKDKARRRAIEKL